VLVLALDAVVTLAHLAPSLVEIGEQGEAGVAVAWALGDADRTFGWAADQERRGG
jgi:hypothetical protein